jgi:hypothetical protein
MERKNRYSGLHPVAVSSLHCHASRLARVNAVPGMDREDYEQELALHLLKRIEQYDEARGSAPTFISRVIENRAKSFRAPTQAKTVERCMLSLDESVDSTGEDEVALEDLVSTEQSLWPASHLSPSERMDLQIELNRLVPRLPRGSRRCLQWLTAGGLQAALHSGVHRSSFYDALERLRAHAQRHGLEEYLRE